MAAVRVIVTAPPLSTEQLHALLAEAQPYLLQVRDFSRALGYGHTRTDIVIDHLLGRIEKALEPPLPDETAA